jgi:putative tricarboxylic transport membrane protein
MKNRLILTVAFAGAAVCFAVLFYVRSLTLPRAAAELPQILCALVFLLSLAMTAEAYLAYRRAVFAVNGAASAKPGSGPFEGVNLGRAGVFVLLVAGYIFSMDRLGYFVVTPLFILVSFLFLRATRLRNVLIIAVGYTAFVYVLFVMFLHLPVPMGFLD